jgi:hypothetical protein
MTFANNDNKTAFAVTYLQPSNVVATPPVLYTLDMSAPANPSVIHSMSFNVTGYTSYVYGLSLSPDDKYALIDGPLLFNISDPTNPFLIPWNLNCSTFLLFDKILLDILQ